MKAYVEAAWLDRLREQPIYRYEMPPATFTALGDAGMWVSRGRVTPLRCDKLDNLLEELDAAGVELQVAALATLRPMWTTSLHVSGVRLRNATSWIS